MIKTYIIGTVLGIVAVFAAAYFVPVVDQHRESSLIAVTPNGGVRETFHINIPMDRIVVGARTAAQPVPPGLQWPDDPIVDGVSAELFKLRNANDTVIGVASRVAATDDTLGASIASIASIEWVLHFPARGSMFVSMQPEAVEGSRRVGRISAGTREFDDLDGRVTERWVSDGSAGTEGPSGRIELVSRFVGKPDSRRDDVHAEGDPVAADAGSDVGPESGELPR